MFFFVVCQAQHSLNNIHCNMWTLCELCPMDSPYPSEPVSSILAATSCLLLPSIPLSSFVKPSPYFPHTQCTSGLLCISKSSTLSCVWPNFLSRGIRYLLCSVHLYLHICVAFHMGASLSRISSALSSLQSFCQRILSFRSQWEGPSAALKQSNNVSE